MLLQSFIVPRGGRDCGGRSLHGSSTSGLIGDSNVTGLEKRDGRWINPRAEASPVTIDLEVQHAIGDLKIVADSARSERFGNAHVERRTVLPPGVIDAQVHVVTLGQRESQSRADAG